MAKKIRVLIAKVGLDGHDRGAKIIARTLRDAGMEVIYTGLRQTAGDVVQAALEEDVDFLGLSFLSGDHMTLIPKVMQGLKTSGLENVRVVVGGIIPENQMEALQRQGIAKIFLPGTALAEIVAYFQEHGQEHTEHP